MHVFQAELTWVQPVLFFCAKGMRSGFTLFGRNLCNVRAQKSRRYSVPIRSQATTRSHEEYLGGWRFTYSIARRGSCRSLVLPELPLRAGGVWRLIRPVPNVQSVSRKRNFALSLRGFRPMVALSITAIQPGMWSSASTTWRQQLRKRSDAVATALNILLGERKLQKAPLSGYWKLNV
jgi:hypothetical protein